MLRIGELAKQTGYTAKTLRYYEDAGLLRPDSRSDSGYRLYDPAAVQRLQFVRRAQGVGLRLDDIRRILEISDEGRAPCEHITDLVDRELDRTAEQLKRLHEFRDGLRALKSKLSEMVVDGCERPGEVCPCFGKDSGG